MIRHMNFHTIGFEAIGSAAEFSGCDRYRYALSRRWSDGPAILFVGLNPSTADAVKDDPTIRRCVGFAKAWGYGALYMANLFARSARRTPAR